MAGWAPRTSILSSSGSSPGDAAGLAERVFEVGEALDEARARLEELGELCECQLPR
jgi:hypothetical protein